MKDNMDTIFFAPIQEQKEDIGDILTQVYEALEKKGYNPINQIVGYIMSGDPTYITGYNSARTLITKFERDEIVEELLKVYIEKKIKR